MTFAELLQKASNPKLPRVAGQWPPIACALWYELRETDPASQRLLEAAIAWELKHERLARPEDEPAVRQFLAKMDADRDAVLAKGAP